MSRYMRARVCLVVTIGGLVALCFVSLRDGWSENAIVASAAGMVVLAGVLEFWRTRA
jgi:hypothetical protein